MLISNGPPNAQGLAAAGILIPARVGYPGILARKLGPQGAALRSAMVQALLDTGAGISAIDQRVLEELGLQPVSIVSIGSAHGSNPHAVYSVLIDLLPVGPAIPTSMRLDPITVIEADLSGQPQQMLLGRDVLSRLLLVYNGPSGIWNLAL